MHVRKLVLYAPPVALLVIAIAMAPFRDPGVPAADPRASGPAEVAIFAGGCFWGLQAAFDKLPGVIHTRAGYTGGETAEPTYEQVVAGRTGHAEAVEVEFDPQQVKYEELLRCFFAHHRATSDEPEATYRTRAYRSAIFTTSGHQHELAARLVAEMAESNPGPKPVATLLESATKFWEAEAYHQKYLAQCAH